MRLPRMISAIASFSRRLSAIGNYDFCPWANRYFYWLKYPLGWFVFAIPATATIGLFIAPQAWLVCLVLTIVMITGVAWPWVSMSGISARMSFNRTRCSEEEAVIVKLQISNRRPWPIWGLLIRGRFSPPEFGQEEEILTALARVPAWSKNHYEFVIHPRRRGELPGSTPTVSTGFPFGLWNSCQQVAVENRLIVWPRCVELKSLPILSGRQVAPIGKLVDRPGADGDIIAARAYRQGDTLRRIHWAHSARRDQLIVCERQRASHRQVLIRLDPLGPALEGMAALQWWDVSMRVVASVCRELHQQGVEVTCELNGARILINSTSSGLRHFFDVLARFEPDSKTHSDATPTIGSPGRASLTLCVTSRSRHEAFIGASVNESTRRKPLSIRAVVIDESLCASLEEGNGRPANRGTSPWIELDTSSNSLQTLQKHWEKKCHDDLVFYS